MSNENQEICLLMAEGRKVNNRERTAIVPETVPALFLLSGILCAFRDMMCAPYCLTGALVSGLLTILALQVSGRFRKAAGIVRMMIYGVSVLCFLGFLFYIAQGFLDTVNRFMVLWNLRFRTEFEQFSVDGRAVAGSLVFWCLVAVLLGALVQVLVKKRRMGLLLLLVMGALFAGFVLGRSDMWPAVLCLLAGTFGAMIYSAAPYRKSGVRGAVCVLFACAAVLVFIFAAGGYEGLSQITRFRADTAFWFEKFRYGEDTLPKGELSRASRLLDGEEEKLRIVTENPQELYLKGFVGGTYDGKSWKEISPEAYQGDYEGLLKWLETKNFSAVTQFADYNHLTCESEGSAAESAGVQVVNVGAYRKYVYVPSTVESWRCAGSREKRDWQVRGGGFFGADEYTFACVDGAPTADTAALAAWVEKPSGAGEENYLDAESVYHSFVEEYYTQVDGELEAVIGELFFSEEEEMDFHDITAQIRRVLRQETNYVEKPQTVPEGQDFVQWFLTGSKKGNAVYYASAAAMAYRTAGYAARYVEGYHLSEEEAARLQEKDEQSVILTSKNAHAWVEVYFPGAGWLPVEVVPGMYTELYTDQVVEGAPAWQVGQNQSEDGLELEGGVSGKEEEKETRERRTLTFRGVLSVVLVCLYACFFLYLLLELQRAVRLSLRRRREKEGRGGMSVDRYVSELERLLVIGGVTGNYNHPLELAGKIEEKIPGVSREEYERAVALLQKMRFGGKELLPYEHHALKCFLGKLTRALTGKKGAWGRFKLRYWYV